MFATLCCDGERQWVIMYFSITDGMVFFREQGSFISHLIQLLSLRGPALQ